MKLIYFKGSVIVLLSKSNYSDVLKAYALLNV